MPNMVRRIATTLVVVLATTGAGLTALIAAEGEADHAEVARLNNPVPATAKSVAAGKVLYLQHCQGCHGPDGKGGPAIGYLKPTPNLTEGKWKHGGSDGEIFDTIKNGVAPDYNMEPWEDRIKDPDIWNLVNFFQSLHRK